MNDLGRGFVPACLVLLGSLAAVWLRVAPHSAAASDEPAPAPWSAGDVARRFPDPDAEIAADRFAGSEGCTECHEDRSASLATSFHAALLEPGTDQSRGCETCHGPGAEHADSAGEDPLRHPLDAPAREVVGVCVRCHAEVLTQPVRGHRDWTDGGAADPDPRACTACHEIHVDRTRPEFAPETGPFSDISGLAAVANPVPARRCIGCHTGFHPEMRRSGHAQFLDQGEQCATCHGNGSLHEASGGRGQLIVNPATQPVKASNAACNRCHSGGAVVQRWTCAEHARAGTGCVACHDANASRGQTLRGTQFELCGSCHQDVQALFRLPNRHRVDHGRVQCTDCHDPHANRDRVRDRDVRVRSCEKCHAEKSGPFLHDHGIKRTEGCIACHAPHGSVNDRMLSHKRIKPLCLQCHAETTHDLADRRYDNCLSCHVEIHGSDLDRNFLR